MASVFKRGGSRTKGYWYASWRDHSGKRQTKCTRTTDKATAERIAHKHEADAALRREGVIDPALDDISRESQRTITSHLNHFQSKLRAANRTEKHVVGTVKVIRTIADFAKFCTASDISLEGVHRYPESYATRDVPLGRSRLTSVPSRRLPSGWQCTISCHAIRWHP